MHIDKARKLKVGSTVQCPPDRGSPGYSGKVTRINPEDKASKTFTGVEFIWVEVNHRSVWPSNRLG